MLDGCSITIAHHISIAHHRSVSHNGPFLVPACSDGLGIQSSRDLEECTDRGRSGSQESVEEGTSEGASKAVRLADQNLTHFPGIGL